MEKLKNKRSKRILNQVLFQCRSGIKDGEFHMGLKVNMSEELMQDSPYLVL